MGHGGQLALNKPLVPAGNHQRTLCILHLLSGLLEVFICVARLAAQQLFTA